MSSTSVVRFGDADWRKGTRGLLLPHATDKAVIRNMRVYANGLLGPRPLWEDPVVIATPGSSSTIIPAEYRYLSTASSGYMTIEGSYVRFYNTVGTLRAEVSVTTQATLLPSITRVSDTLWLVGDCLIDLATDTSSAVPFPITVNRFDTDFRSVFGVTSWLPSGSAVHQGRAYYWGGAYDASSIRLNPNRVYYSNSIITDGYDGYYSVDSAAQYFDVDGEVKGCVSVGSTLYIWTREGRWTMMQGSGDPANATFSNMGVGKIPADEKWPQHIDQAAVFQSSDGMSIVTLLPGGSVDDQSLTYLGFDETARGYTEDSPPAISVSSLHNATLIPGLAGEDVARYHWNGVWSDETWGVATEVVSSNAGYQVRADEIYGRESLMVHQSGGDWHVYNRDIVPDGPSLSAAEDYSEYAELYTADAAGFVQLPRIAEANKQTRINRVIIDCVFSSGADAPSPGLTITVEDGKGNSTDLTIGPGPDVFNDETGSVRLVGTGAPTAHTHFSDISISDIQGILIEGVTVVVDTSEGPIH